MVKVLQEGVMCHRVCPKPMYFERLSGDHVFCESEQFHARNAKLFNNLNQGDYVWHADVLEVSRRWEGEVSDGSLVPLTHCDGTLYYY